jgi:muskelin
MVIDGNDEEYIARQKYKARFEEIMTNPDNKNRPSPRTNAAFSFDDTRRRLYMFGGFSEQNELDDFWMYDVAKNEWIMLENTSGISPSARAGSKMIYDEIGNQLFLIGRKSLKGYENFKSDFYLYDLTRNSWMLICDDTSLENGPHVISDHQICINQESRTIYVFGGKVADK